MEKIEADNSCFCVMYLQRKCKNFIKLQISTSYGHINNKSLSSYDLNSMTPILCDFGLFQLLLEVRL